MDVPTSDTQVSRREVAVAAASAVLIAAAVYGQFAFRGGWVGDDWEHVAVFELGFQSLADELTGIPDRIVGSYRPLHWVVAGVVVGIAGENPTGALLLAVPLVALQTALLYAVLRLVGLGRVAAAGPAVLLLVLPTIDATRLWPASYYTSVGVVLYLAGAAAAMVGLRGDLRRRRLAWQVAAAVLIVTAMLVYEALIAVVAITPLLYLARSGWRRARALVARDVVLAVAVYVSMSADANRERGADLSLGHVRERADVVWEAAMEAFQFSLPADRVLWGPVGLAVLLAAALGAGKALGRDERMARAVRQWGLVALLGLAFAAAGAAVLLGAPGPAFDPSWRGPANRFWGAAGIGAAVAGAALVWLVALGLSELAGRPRAAAPLAMVLLAVTAAGLLRQELRNQDDWERSWRESQAVLAGTVAPFGGRLPAGAGVAPFHHLNVVTGGIPVFNSPYDLQAALRLRQDDDRIKAHPYELPVRCEAHRAAWTPHGGPAHRSDSLPYGRLWFVDLRTRAAYRIRDREDCLRALSRLS